MARVRSSKTSTSSKRKLSAWNIAVRKAYKNGAGSFVAAVKTAKKTYKPKTAGKSSPKRSSPKRSSPKRCPKGSHRRIRGKGPRCVKN